jgi:hypothetical protein
MRLDLGFAPVDQEEPLATLDLGEPSTPSDPGGTGACSIGYFDGGDLGLTAGNLYIYLDGREVGSLFIHLDSKGVPRVLLGQYDPERDDWVDRNNLTFIPGAEGSNVV